METFKEKSISEIAQCLKLFLLSMEETSKRKMLSPLVETIAEKDIICNGEKTCLNLEWQKAPVFSTVCILKDF